MIYITFILCYNYHDPFRQETGEGMTIIIIAIALIVTVVAIRIAYSYGRQDGLQHPTEEATRRLQEVKDKTDAEQKKLSDLLKELDRLAPLRIRAAIIRRQERLIVKITRQIEGVEGTIYELSQEIARLLNEAASHPAIAEMISTDAQVTVRQNRRLDATHRLAELQMDLAKAEQVLVELADELDAKRQQTV